MASHTKPEALVGSAGPARVLAQMAAAQGVVPVDDLDALAALWPTDDDPDALDAFIAEQRAARRDVVRRGA